ncbi:MAG TPA: TetR/AcrR family transcriptional regulator [Myxococcaceae bacterium]|nr:TetR/AcrR family transcriptional regulator [Myxococcaceae bacterium]
MRLFWEQGYEGTSVGDLTDAMGINRPSLYAAFGCKEALFVEAVALYDAVEGAAATRALEAAPTAREAVTAVLRTNVTAYANRATPRGCMIVLAAAVGAPENSAVRAHLASLRRRDMQAIEERIARGVRDGDVPAGADPATAAAFYVAVLHGLSIQARDRVPDATLRAVAERAITGWEVLMGTTGSIPRGSPPGSSPRQP